ncbi:MAG: D-alanyl-D-alanine carboxypeptidase [Desulfovibrionaceae bacterium]|nr:D-alanyl-D-alanine carboxypeptidase [Desulfovibrionaceae bacterium]
MSVLPYRGAWCVRLAGVVLLSAVLALAPQAGQGAPIRRGPVQARSVILLDLDTVTVLYEQDADRKVPPASLTKILSMYVVFDRLRAGGLSLKDKVRVSRAAATTGGSRMGLRAGEKLSLEKLLYGMAVASGNDASCAVAEHVAGSQASFVKMMNAKAQKLGMSRSVFATVNGLPARGQVTTARDMLHLARNYIAMYPDALRYHSTRSITHHGRTSVNRNPLLGTYQGADGLKTGWTTASGYNIITTARRGKTRLLAVLLGAGDSHVRKREIQRLMDAGFAVRAGKAASVAAALGVSPKKTVASRK